MNPLQEEIAERIRSGGPLPFAAFMQMVLYHPKHGYYSSGAQRTGWRGHFLTSPELDPSFGALWTRAFEQLWRACGSPESFEIVEIGPGEGGFARAVLDSLTGDFRDAVTYRLVERTPSVRQRQETLLGDRVVWTESITELPEIGFGCIFANEVLDNLPVHLVEMRAGALVELCVGMDEDRLVLVARAPSNPELPRYLERIGVDLPEGNRYEATLAAESLIGRVAERLRTGAIVFVDYGMEAEELAVKGGSLVAYSKAVADTDVLAEPGERDVTAHANWTSAALALQRAGLATAGPVPQREVLLALGARDLDTSLKSDYEAAIAAGRGADAVAVLSRRQALGALLDPGGLGGLHILAGVKGIDRPRFLT